MLAAADAEGALEEEHAGEAGRERAAARHEAKAAWKRNNWAWIPGARGMRSGRAWIPSARMHNGWNGSQATKNRRCIKHPLHKGLKSENLQFNRNTPGPAKKRGKRTRI